MDKTKSRKTDRRTLYTRKLIKDNFIALLDGGIPIEKISVSELCRRAEINRCTFYLHFVDIYAVLEDLQNELQSDIAQCVQASLADESKRQMICADMFSSIRENHVYRVLSKHNLTLEILKRSSEFSKNLLVRLCVETKQLTPREAELFSLFLISGCAAISEDQLLHHWDTFTEDNAFTNIMLERLYSLVDIEAINHWLWTERTAAR